MKVEDINFLETKYCFSSGTGEIGVSRYVNQYNIEILGQYDDEEENEKSQLIGKASIYLFLMDLVQNDDFSIFELFDSEQANRDLGGLVIDWDMKEVNEYFQDIIDNSQSSNILYISRIEILPQFKGKNFGKYVMKDIISRFNNCCGFIALKAFPLQLAVSDKSDNWYQQMEYDKYVQDEKLAKKQLYNFYKSIGFSQYQKSEYFYLDPSLRNKKLEKVDLNQSY